MWMLWCDRHTWNPSGLQEGELCAQLQVFGGTRATAQPKPRQMGLRGEETGRGLEISD